MICEGCGGEAKLRVTHTYSVQGVGRVQSLACSGCARRYTLVSMLAGEVKQRGDGAFALATRMRKGEFLLPGEPTKE